MTTVYQCDVVACAMFLTGQASNVLIAKFAPDAAGYELLTPMDARQHRPASSLPGRPLIYRIYHPEVKQTPRDRVRQRGTAELGPCRATSA
jgi:DASS family divalent anion:Na+ symporter